MLELIEDDALNISSVFTREYLLTELVTGIKRTSLGKNIMDNSLNKLKAAHLHTNFNSK